MTVLLLLSTALAAPPDYRVTKKDVEGCTLYLGPADADGDIPMHAECHWPDVSIETFRKHFEDWAHHADMFGTVARSEVRRTDGDRSLVFQRHSTSGISDREVLLWMQKTTVDGYERYGWTKATDESFTAASDSVECKKSTGYWQVKASPKGGVEVINHLAYDPGGRVPGFMVRWFQTSGLEATVTDAKKAMR